MHNSQLDVIIWIIALLSILLMLVRPRGIAEAYWAGAGAILLVVAGLISPRQAGQAVLEGLGVYLFLVGMMILAELAREEGVFDWVADLAAQRARGSPARLFALIYLAGIVVTAVLSNDATAVVLTPAVLAAVRRARVAPKPYLLICALIANAASFVFPISNPANLVMFDGHVPELAAWLRVFLLPSAVSIGITFLALRFVCRGELSGTIPGGETPMHLSVQGKLALAGLLLAAAALTGASALGWPLGLSTCVAALAVMIVVASRDPTLPLRIGKGVSWAVIPLVGALFVIMQALQNAGMLRMALWGLRELAHTSDVLAKMAAACGAALLSNAMNNLPVGLIGGAAIQKAHESGVVAHAILIGVDLGPNLSVTGSLATILWLIALRRENVQITAWEFLRIGMIAMPLALAGAVLALWN